jgi:hypothetical protein
MTKIEQQIVDILEVQQRQENVMNLLINHWVNEMKYSNFDTDKVVDCLNLLTSINDNITKNEMFSAGFNLGCLKNHLVEMLIESEKSDKEFKRE